MSLKKKKTVIDLLVFFELFCPYFFLSTVFPTVAGFLIMNPYILYTDGFLCATNISVI